VQEDVTLLLDRVDADAMDTIPFAEEDESFPDEFFECNTWDEDSTGNVMDVGVL
jgi:hypothetical protein